MAEVKNTRKKPAAKKPAQNAADTATEELEKTGPETTATAERSTEQTVAEKPAKKKSSKQPAKTTKSKQQDESAATDVDAQITDTAVPAEADEQKVEEPPVETSEQPAAVDEQKAESENTEEKAEPAVQSEEPAANSEKPIKTSGKKFPLSRNMIIILSCVLAIVLIGVILAVSLTSCKSDNDNNKKYTVTFIVDGEVMTSYTLSAGERVSSPKTDPSKEMFTFDGWYLVNPNNSNQRQKFVFDTKISQHITLVAVFAGKTDVKIEFNPNGGAFEDNKQVELLVHDGENVTEPTDKPTRVGYTFDGWYTEEDCYNKFQFGTSPIENFTLYAGWAKDTENYVYIKYYGNGELLREDPVRKEENVVLPDFFGDNDDIVVGDWVIENNPNRPYTPGKATEDLNLYVNYYTDGLVFTTTRTNATVAGYNGTATEVIVPSVYNGKTVTDIGNDAFYRTRELPAVTSIKLPDTITRIGNRAFYDCQYLVSVNLTYRVTSIGSDAFYRNLRLRSVGDISGVEGERLGEGAFNGCRELRTITLGNLLTKIADYTFNDCASLTQVKLPDALVEIGEYAFSGCTALKSVALESLVLASIADNAFADCSSLTDVTISKTSGEVTMQGNPFANCRNVKIYVPSALLETYQNNTNNTQFKDKLTAR
ncbi:MAG: leucine-rich repeat protein [Clostridiales bacterium]|nr:leucine-rich repeat protein [Clostridiales bacterium]